MVFSIVSAFFLMSLNWDFAFVMLLFASKYSLQCILTGLSKLSWIFLIWWWRETLVLSCDWINLHILRVFITICSEGDQGELYWYIWVFFSTFYIIDVIWLSFAMVIFLALTVSLSIYILLKYSFFIFFCWSKKNLAIYLRSASFFMSRNILVSPKVFIPHRWVDVNRLNMECNRFFLILSSTCLEYHCDHAYDLWYHIICMICIVWRYVF